MNKKTPFLLIAAALFVAACEQRTETTTATDSSGTVQTKTTTVTGTVPAVDTTATAQAKEDAKEATHEGANAARDAHATGTAMETAGKEIQQRTDTRKH